VFAAGQKGIYHGKTLIRCLFVLSLLYHKSAGKKSVLLVNFQPNWMRYLGKSRQKQNECLVKRQSQIGVLMVKPFLEQIFIVPFDHAKGLNVAAL